MSPTLDSGLEVAHFRIDRLLGEGGMGEVYRARDTRLERWVALKILPPRLVADPSRLDRFAREARAASGLAHPNIVTIYEIGEAPAPAAGGEQAPKSPSRLHYIAMELIDGSTLRDLLADESVDLRTLLGYLGQAAEGIARAHEAGVIHRDLKPDNVMITRDGLVKVLDFGLAKLDATVDPPADLTGSPTVQGEATRAGAVLGTVGYMSPEQVRGRPADSRSDVFAFGCLLYQAATRRPPFAGESSIDTMHQILRAEPRPMERLNPSVPGALRRLVRRCLAKEPERRHQSMKDLALELADLVAEFDSLAPASNAERDVVESEAAPPAAPSGRRRLRFGAAAVALALAVAAAAYWIRSADSPRGTDAPPGPTTAAPPQPTLRDLTTTADVGIVAISPDGAYLAQARWRPRGTGLWITHLATGSSVEVLAPEGDLDLRGVTFTPDGNYLDFVRNDPERPGYSSAFRIPVLGGEPRRLVSDIDSAPSFSPDGARMAFLRGAPQIGAAYLMVADADGDNAAILAETLRPDWFELAEPAWSPDGESILTIRDVRGGLTETIVSVDAASGRINGPVMAEEVQDVDSLAWLPDGTGIVFTGRRGLERSQLWLLELPGGEMRPLTQGVSTFNGVTVTADGRTLASRQEITRSQIWIAPADRPDNLRPLTGNPRDLVGAVAVDADGRVFFERFDPSGSQIWRTTLEGERPVQLTHDAFWTGPEVSADGSLLVARRRATAGEPMQLWRLDPETGEPLERLVQSATNVWQVGLAPDASWLAADVDDGELWIQPAAGGAPRRVADRLHGGPFVSPDGSLVAYVGFRVQPDGTGTPWIGLLTPDGTSRGGLPAGRVQDADGAFTGFSPDGTALIAHQYVGGVTNLWRVPLDGGEWTRLTDLAHGLQGYIADVAWSPDGRWLVLTKGEYLSDAVLLESFR